MIENSYRSITPLHHLHPLILVLNTYSRNTFPLTGYPNLPHQTRPLLSLNHLWLPILLPKVTLRRTAKDHTVEREQTLDVMVQMGIGRETNELGDCEAKFVVMQRVIPGDPDAPHNPRLGAVCLNLAQYVDAGVVTLRWQSKTNATLKVFLLSISTHPELTTNSPPRQTHHRYNSAQTPLSEQTPTPHAQHAPLADISMDATPVPRKVVKLAIASPEAQNSGVERYSSPVSAIRASHATLAPAGSPLASVINAINFTDQNMPSVGRIPEHVTPTIVVSRRQENPSSSIAQLSPSPSTALLTHTHLSESVLTSSDAPLSPPAKYQTQSPPSNDTFTAPTARPRL
ncbi:hypothetical protein P692DRAFT_20883217, partial [Suillus brevipes Sb2]